MSAPLLVVEDRDPEFGYYKVWMNGRLLGALASPIQPSWDYRLREPWDTSRDGVIEVRFVEVPLLLEEPKTPRRRWSRSMGLRRPE